jgi:hypothetical protein
MANFFIENSDGSDSMADGRFLTMVQGTSKFVGMYGAVVDYVTVLVPKSSDESVLGIAENPFNRLIPLWSVDLFGHMHRINLIARKPGVVRLIAEHPGAPGSDWASSTITVLAAPAATSKQLTIQIHDVRLAGNTPKETVALKTVRTDESMPVQSTINAVVDTWKRLVSNRTDVTVDLQILCHGMSFKPIDRPQNVNPTSGALLTYTVYELLSLAGEATGISQVLSGPALGRGEGGAGLLLGKEMILAKNIDSFNFSSWKGKFSSITLYACGAAYIEPGVAVGIGARGDGYGLCQKLANLTATPVIASSAIQRYHYKDANIEFGEWEGDVFTIKPEAPKMTPVRHLRMR